MSILAGVSGVTKKILHIATRFRDGLMSRIDKRKLDGIEYGATNNANDSRFLQGYNLNPLIIQSNDPHNTFASWVVDYYNTWRGNRGSGFIQSVGKIFSDLPVGASYYGIMYTYSDSNSMFGLIVTSADVIYALKVAIQDGVATLTLEKQVKSNDLLSYGVCSTAAATANKTATLPSFELATGAKATVKFTYGNTASNPTLNFNSTGAKSIFYRGSTLTILLPANEVLEVVYDGTRYNIVGELDSVYEVMPIDEGVTGSVDTARTLNAWNLNRIIKNVAWGNANGLSPYRPDLWTPISVYDFGNNLYGTRYKATITSNAGVEGSNLILPGATNIKIISSGGWFSDGTNKVAIGQYKSAQIHSCIYIDLQQNMLFVSTVSDKNRASADIDIWVLFTNTAT